MKAFSKLTILIILLVIVSCENKDDGVDPNPNIIYVEVMTDKAGWGDTLFLEHEYKNFTPEKDKIKIFVDGIEASPTFTNDELSQLFIIIPRGVKAGFIYVMYEDIKTADKSFTLIESIEIVSLSPNNGKVGTHVTLEGYGFDFFDSVTFYIGSIPCKTISLSFEKVVIEIPEGAGSGYIICKVNGDSDGDLDANSPTIFNYEFNNVPQRLLKILFEGELYTEYKHDNLGRVSEEYFKGSIKNTYIYNQDNLVDTIYNYNESEKTGYIKYLRDNNLVTTKTYKISEPDTDALSTIQKFYYEDGIVAKYELFWRNKSTGDWYLRELRDYEYDKNKCVWNIVEYESDGSTIFSWQRDHTIDISNKKIDLGIPGLAEEHSFNVIHDQFASSNEFLYNEYGNVAKRIRIISSEEKYEFQYIYEDIF